MWDTIDVGAEHLSRTLNCPRCGHEGHVFLPCDMGTCTCEAQPFPGAVPAPRRG
ncbi:hypothetical protein [Nocardioides sp. Kera G14]|uniref:hypothetical protein n=1 Tax=Nocardioides sp. Kera G14 TaxID=2884264 RepID=UPI001D118418|nr:hypothetical protein [Nocardioides sp. Kera G14]UDY25226.1 hypothetical protein LH076_08050 [Nocardioides sp. Kera G14]